MSQYMTSNDIIESVKIRASVPENQATFSPEDFLQLANEELMIGLVPSIMQLHEDYFLYEEDVDIVQGRNEYPIPYRAVGNKLRDVQFKHANGHYSEMTRISIGQRFYEYDSQDELNLKKYYVKNNSVVLTPDTNPNLTGTLSFVYYIRPSKLVTEERVGIITGINTTTGEVILSEFPENFNSTSKYDFYKAKSPHKILSIDLTATNLNPTTKTVTFNPSDIPQDLEVGDHLALACEAIIPQIPSDLHVILAHRVACRILESIGDTEGLANANKKLAEMEMKTGTLIDSRVDDSPQKIVNRHGLVRTSIYAKRFNRR